MKGTVVYIKNQSTKTKERVGQKSTLKLEIQLPLTFSQGSHQSTSKLKFVNTFTAHTLLIDKFSSMQIPLKLSCLPQKLKFRSFTLQAEIKMN
jgi:hypothetical protein